MKFLGTIGVKDIMVRDTEMRMGQDNHSNTKIGRRPTARSLFCAPFRNHRAFPPQATPC